MSGCLIAQIVNLVVVAKLVTIRIARSDRYLHALFSGNLQQLAIQRLKLEKILE
jgi:hypothetical protein